MQEAYLGVGIVAKCGLMTPDQLAGLADLARKVDCQYCKMTTRQTIVFLIPEEKLDELREGVRKIGLRIGVFGEIVRNVKACAGNRNLCQRALSDVFDLGGEIQDRFMNQPTPCDFKISVAGCHRGCTDPYCADYGIIAVGDNRYNIYLGGRGGSRNPVHGVLIAESVSGEGVMAVLEQILQVYRDLAFPRERICNTIKRTGLKPFMPSDEFLAKYRSHVDNDFLAFAGVLGEEANS